MAPYNFGSGIDWSSPDVYQQLMRPTPSFSPMREEGLPEQSMAPSTAPAQAAQPIRTLQSTPSFEDTMAPYEAMASRFNNPYNMMSQNSWLAKTHPQAAGIMDRAMTAAAMTPEPQGPEGVGGGISRAFQGVMGAQNLYRQKALTAAMLPYEMMMPQLQARHLMAQTGQEQAAASYYGAHANYLGSMANVNQQKADEQQRKNDIAQYGKEMPTPAERYGYGATLQKYGLQTRDQMTPDQMTEANDLVQQYNKQDRMTRVKSGQFTQGDIIAMQMSNDDKEKAMGIKAGKIWSSMYGQRAAATTAGGQDVPHPQVTAEELVAASRARIGKDLTKPPADYIAWTIQHPERSGEGEAGFQADTADYTRKLLDEHKAHGAYVASGAAKQGIPFEDWQDKNLAGGATPAPKSTGSSWTPNR